ncbi:alpha/beta hydrolase family protein [Paracraurococcus lichenis]|uniref:Alpha/beta fold hydrolase n=1 Tax=Paracraurococcus lichenis TaxID=3064888 RepID=A0ABT9DU91_9PROT|nr:alpha/beta fold hydrolase [Paracraurococcus sp. LOR1-02]MDO9707470.1 alpha/beta fold hydrolase [Paracraurococcus sp. LOR1-02]
MLRRLADPAIALLAVAAILFGLLRLTAATEGLAVSPLRVGEVPAAVYRQAGGGPAPVVVIAHGFAGAQQMMQPFATTLAQAGYVAVTFDFPGHARNPTPLAGGLTDDKAASGVLLDALGRVAEAARPLGDGRLAVLGHSMAADIVIRYAFARPEVAAVVAFSGFGPEVTATQPRNLLVAAGAWEPEFLQDAARRIVAEAAGGAPAERMTYGDFAAGTARRLVLVAGVEHIAVLYARESLIEARAWLNAAFGRGGEGRVDARGGAIGLLLGGLVLLARPLARLLPRAAAAPMGAGLPWRRLWPVALLPAIATPLLLRLFPPHALPLLLGDYLMVHCGLYGLLTAAGLWWARVPRPRIAVSAGATAVATAALAAYAVLGIGTAIDRYVLSFLPAAHRLWLVPVLLCGTLPWFLADEWATRGPGAARFGYAATKLLFLLSLIGAVALDPPRLFFLAIIVPVMLLFLLVFGLISRWSWRATNSPVPAALANALALAWAMAATFPMVPR